MAKIAALISKKHDNVFDTNANVMLHLPKPKVPKAKTEETVFTSVRHLTPSLKILINALIWLSELTDWEKKDAFSRDCSIVFCFIRL